MAIVSSHFVWQRERSEHHSGAQRQYGYHTRIPRGPSASPVSCALCKRGTGLDHGQGASSPSRGFSVQTPNPAFSHPFTSALSLEITPPRAAVSRRKAVETKRQAQHSFCCCAEEVPSRYHVSQKQKAKMIIIFISGSFLNLSVAQKNCNLKIEMMAHEQIPPTHLYCRSYLKRLR